jgi:hypothetical protein
MRFGLLGLAALALTANSNAAPLLTFANFSQSEAGQGVQWNSATRTVRTITADNAVNGSWTFNAAGIAGGLPGALLGSPLAATLTFHQDTTATATCVQVAGAPNNCTQRLNGLRPTTDFFRIDLVTPFIFNHHTYTNLLTATYTGLLQSSTGSNVASIISETSQTSPQYTLAYSSDFLDFTDTVDRSMILALSGLNPGYGVAGGSTTILPGVTLRTGANTSTFTSSITGQFGANPKAAGTLVPEPSSMLLFGSAVAALGLLRRKAVRR